MISNQELRLFNINAFETAQPCWRAAGAEYACRIEATRALTAIVAGRSVTCTGTTPSSPTLTNRGIVGAATWLIGLPKVE